MRNTKANNKPFKSFLFEDLQFFYWLCNSPWTRVVQQNVGRVGVWLVASPSAQLFFISMVTHAKDLLNNFFVTPKGWTGGEWCSHPINRLLAHCLGKESKPLFLVVPNEKKVCRVVSKRHQADYFT